MHYIKFLYISQVFIRGRTSDKTAQHKGLGKKLMKKAEQITKREFGLDKMSVISGVGVRGYYRKLGYKLQDTYMIKNRLQ